MDTKIRRDHILKLLENSKNYVPGHDLAESFNVTRQVIVKDISILKAEGYNIISSSKGYYINSSENLFKTIAVKHEKNEIEIELRTIIDCGAKVIDVTVEHPVYGQLIGSLEIENHIDIDIFLDKIKTSNPLSIVNHGIHLHKIEYDNENQYLCVLNALRDLNILID
jgi:hypothetical protein